MDYRATLNLPQTSFKMKANLSQREPEVLKQWTKTTFISRYRNTMLTNRFSSCMTVLRMPTVTSISAPPSTRFSRMLFSDRKGCLGFNAPYIPGWDCHGLPIEHNVDKELGDKKKIIPILSKRKACRTYAEKWIKTQKIEFKRLGVIGDWDNPYLTMNHAYEATIAREFNKFLYSGSVIRSKKPVYWCSTCTTALAEAEVEYHNHTSASIYVKFRVSSDLSDIDPRLGGDDIFVVIWTTTPWTLRQPGCCLSSRF